MKNENPDVIYLVLDIGLLIESNSVLQAQVVDQALALRGNGLRVTVICFYNDKDLFMDIAGNLLVERSVELKILPNRTLVRNIVTAAWVLRGSCANARRATVYTRTIWAALSILLASPVRSNRYVYDVRGDIVDENKARGRSRLRQFVLQRIESFVIRKASQVTTVTTTLAQLIKQRAGLKTIPDVIPSCIDSNQMRYDEITRERVRKELGYTENDIVAVYSGGVSKYQCLPEMISLWRTLLRNGNTVKFLLIVSADRAQIEKTAGSLQDFKDRITVLNLPRREVFNYLQAADVGFLLRESRNLNAAASPVKFAEYLAAGLGIVTSPDIGDLSATVESNKIGVLIRPALEYDKLEELNRFISVNLTDRRRLRSNALELSGSKYCWAAYQESFITIYKRD